MDETSYSKPGSETLQGCESVFVSPTGAAVTLSGHCVAVHNALMRQSGAASASLPPHCAVANAAICAARRNASGDGGGTPITAGGGGTFGGACGVCALAANANIAVMVIAQKIEFSLRFMWPHSSGAAFSQACCRALHWKDTLLDAAEHVWSHQRNPAVRR